MLTLALSSWSLHRHLPSFDNGVPGHPEEEGIPVVEFPGIAHSYGIGEIEICQQHLASTDPAYLTEVRGAVDAAGCRVINVPIDVGDLSQPDAATRDADLQLIEQWIDAAQQLGSPAVRVNTGHPGNQDEAEALRNVAAGYRRLAAYCAERGMTLLMENHGGLSAAPGAIMALVEAVDAPNFRLCPDFGNFAPAAREEGLREMLPHAAVVHAKVLDVDEQGRHSAFDLARCLELVRQSGYSGSLSIEFEGQGDERAGIATAQRLIQQYVGDLLVS